MEPSTRSVRSPRAAPSPAQVGRLDRPNQHGKEDENHEQEQGREDRDLGSHKLKRKKYEAELATLQAELVALQEWVKATGAKICIVFEGRDTAGKGGTINGSWSG